MPFHELVSRRRRTRVSVVVLTLGTLFTLVTCKLNDLLSPTSQASAKPTVSLSVDSVVTLGGTLKLSATVSAPGATVSASEYGIAWSVSNPAMATIATDGTLTGVAIGSVQVTARVVAPELGDNGPTASKNIRVGYAGIKIAAVDSLRAIGATRTMVVNGLNAAGNSVAPIPAAQLTYTVRDTTVMKVDANGVLTARKSATTYVLASTGGLTDSVAVKVRQVAKTANFGGASKLLVGALNKARTIAVSAYDSTNNLIPAAIPTVAWSVNNSAVATIGASTGSLTALKVDTTTITAVVDGVAAKILMSVQQIPATIAKVAGDARSDTVTQAVKVLPKVTVADSGGTAIPNDTVVFTVASGNGSISSGATQVTDATGAAIVGPWVLGPTAAAQSLLATASPASATFTVTGIPLAAKRMLFAAQPQTASSGGVLPSFQVAIADSIGNVVTSAASSLVTLSLGSNPGSATLGGTDTAHTTNGVATFNNVTVSAGGTGYTLLASAGPYAAGTSNPFVVYGAKAKLAVTTQPQAGRKGQVLPAIQISIQDAAGNVVGNATDSVSVAITTSTGATGAHLTGTTKVAAVGGIATFSALVIDSVGQASTGNPYKLTATSGTLASATTNSFDVKPVGTAAQLAFTVQPVSTTAGTTMASISVAVQDSGGGLVNTATNSITLGVQTGPATIASGTTTVSAVNGVANFTNIIVNKTGTGYSFNAVASGLTTAVSNTFNINAAATGTKLVFIQQPYNAGLSQTISPAVTVAIEDNFNNIITTDTTSVTLSIATGATGATLTGGAAAHPSSGVATFSGLSIGTLGTGYTLSATANGRTTATSSSFNIVAASGTAMKLAFSAQPNNATAGSAISPNIVVVSQDAAGTNTTPVGSSSVTLSVASGPSGATTLFGSTTVGLTSGTATFSTAQLNTAGTYTLQATSTSGLNPVTSTSFVVSPAGRQKIVFVNQPSTAVAGTALTAPATASCSALCVAVEDQYNNVITSDNTDQITLSVNGGSPTSLAGTTTVQVQNGIASFSNVRVRTAGTSVVLNAFASSLAAQTSGFTVNPAPEYGVQFKTQPTSIVATTTYASGSQIQVQLVDSLGNLISTATDSVKLSIASGPVGGTISGTATVAAVSGVATFPSVSFSTAGTYVLTATSGSLATANSISFQVTSGTANKLVFTAQPTSPIAAGTSMGFTVTVEDASNNVVTGATATISLSLGSNPGATSLSGSTSAGPSSGVATFSNVQVTKAGAGYTIIATAPGLTSATSAAFTIVAGSPSQMAFTTQPQPVGYGLGQTVAVSLEDAYGNVVTSNSTASITLTAGGATFVNGSSTVVLSSGVATFTGLAIEPAGTYTLAANATGASVPTQSSSSFVVSAPGTVSSSGTDATQTWGGGVIVVGSTAYWTAMGTGNATGTLNSASIYGGTTTTLLTGLESPGPISSDGAGNLYWPAQQATGSQLGYITRYNIAGKTVTTVITGTNPNRSSADRYHVDTDGSNLYFTAFPSGGSGYNVYRVAANASGLTMTSVGVTKLTTTNDVGSFLYTTVGGTATIFYAGSGGVIYRFTNPSGTPSASTTVVSSTTAVPSYGFAVTTVAGTPYLYWTTNSCSCSGGPGSLYSVAALASAATPSLVSVSNVANIATDGTSLYLTQVNSFSTTTFSGVTSLVRYNTNTSTLTTIGGSPTGTAGFVSGSDFYWTDANGVLKAPK